METECADPLKGPGKVGESWGRACAPRGDALVLMVVERPRARGQERLLHFLVLDLHTMRFTPSARFCVPVPQASALPTSFRVTTSLSTREPSAAVLVLFVLQDHFHVYSLHSGTPLAKLHVPAAITPDVGGGGTPQISFALSHSHLAVVHPDAKSVAFCPVRVSAATATATDGDEEEAKIKIGSKSEK